MNIIQRSNTIQLLQRKDQYKPVNSIHYIYLYYKVNRNYPIAELFEKYYIEGVKPVCSD